MLKEAHNSPLLNVTLRGIAKFGHLISIEYFNDLIASIQQVMHSEKIKLMDQLQCVVTGFRLLSGHTSALIIDLSDYYRVAYKCLGDATDFIA